MHHYNTHKKAGAEQRSVFLFYYRLPFSTMNTNCEEFEIGDVRLIFKKSGQRVAEYLAVLLPLMLPECMESGQV